MEARFTGAGPAATLATRRLAAKAEVFMAGGVRVWWQRGYYGESGRGGKQRLQSEGGSIKRQARARANEWIEAAIKSGSKEGAGGEWAGGGGREVGEVEEDGQK